jgi:putative ABC transport system permease protein
LKIGDVIGTAWDGVRSRKFRFALNLIGILIGCVAVTGLVSMTQGMNIFISDQLGAVGATTLQIIPGSMSSGGGGFNVGDFARTLTWKDLNIIKKIPNIEYISPISTGGSGKLTVKGKTYTRSIYGVSDQFFKINKSMELENGRTFLNSDSAVAVIGHTVAQPKDEDLPILEVGDRIQLTTTVNGVVKEITLRIIGVLKQTGGSFSQTDSLIIIPQQTYEQIFETSGKFTVISLTTYSTDNIAQVTKDIKAKLDQVSVISAATAQAMVDRILGTIQAVLGGIAAISLVVAGVGIINTMTISVMERTKEIGTIKALGGKSRDILLIFLSESILTGIVGGTIGALGGFALSIAVGAYIGLAPDLSLSLGLFVVGFSVVTCVLSGLYPSWRASSLSPVEALRHE